MLMLQGVDRRSGLQERKSVLVCAMTDTGSGWLVPQHRGADLEPWPPANNPTSMAALVQDCTWSSKTVSASTGRGGVFICMLQQVRCAHDSSMAVMSCHTYVQSVTTMVYDAGSVPVFASHA